MSPPPFDGVMSPSGSGRDPIRPDEKLTAEIVGSVLYPSFIDVVTHLQEFWNQLAEKLSR